MPKGKPSAATKAYIVRDAFLEKRPCTVCGKQMHFPQQDEPPEDFLERVREIEGLGNTIAYSTFLRLRKANAIIRDGAAVCACLYCTHRSAGTVSPEGVTPEMWQA